MAIVGAEFQDLGSGIWGLLDGDVDRLAALMVICINALCQFASRLLRALRETLVALATT